MVSRKEDWLRNNLKKTPSSLQAIGERRSLALQRDRGLFEIRFGEYNHDRHDCHRQRHPAG
jgi:hypothetical protein